MGFPLSFFLTLADEYVGRRFWLGLGHGALIVALYMFLFPEIISHRISGIPRVRWYVLEVAPQWPVRQPYLAFFDSTATRSSGVIAPRVTRRSTSTPYICSHISLRPNSRSARPHIDQNAIFAGLVYNRPRAGVLGAESSNCLNRQVGCSRRLQHSVS